MTKKDKNVITVDPQIYELMKKAGVPLLNLNIKIKDKKEEKDNVKTQS